MLWVLKRTVSMWRFFITKTHVKIDGKILGAKIIIILTYGSTYKPVHKCIGSSFSLYSMRFYMYTLLHGCHSKE